MLCVWLQPSTVVVLSLFSAGSGALAARSCMRSRHSNICRIWQSSRTDDVRRSPRVAKTRSVISSWTEQLDTNNKILKANRANDAPVYLCANISPYCWSNTSHQWCTIAGTMHAVNCFKAPMRQLYVYMMRPIPSHWRLIEPYNKYIQSICSAHNARVKCNCKNSMTIILVHWTTDTREHRDISTWLLDAEATMSFWLPSIEAGRYR